MENLQTPTELCGETASNTESIDETSSACMQCARTGHSCCCRHEIYVTIGDCRRIAAGGYTGFYEYRPCENPAYSDQEDDPFWRQNVFRSDGSRRVLKQGAGGACIFLTETGCRLSLFERPLICRLYPHVYTADGVSENWDQDCIATRNLQPDVIERQIAGVKPQDTRQWHDMLYKEISWEGMTNENRIDV